MLVGRVAVGIDQGDHQPFNPGCTRVVNCSRNTFGVNRGVHAAVGIHPLSHRKHAVFADQGIGALGVEVIGIGHFEPGDFKHVDKVLGGD